jgi:hypothetical protein
MATSSRTRRAAPSPAAASAAPPAAATPARQAAARKRAAAAPPPAEVAAAAPAPAPAAQPAAKAPAAKPATAKQVTAKQAPAKKAAVKQASEKQAATKQAAKKAPARKTAQPATPPVAAAAAPVPVAPVPVPEAAPTPAAVPEVAETTPAAKQTAKPAAKPAAAKPAAKKPAAKKAVAKKAAAGKTARQAGAAGRAAAVPAADTATAAPAPDVAPVTETPADLPAAPPVATETSRAAAVGAAPVVDTVPQGTADAGTEDAADGDGPPTGDADAAADVAGEADTPADSPANTSADAAADTSTDTLDDAGLPESGTGRRGRNRHRNRRRRGGAAADPQALATAEAVLAVLDAPTAAAAPDAQDRTDDLTDTDDALADVAAEVTTRRRPAAAAAAAAPAPQADAPAEPPVPPTGPAHSQIVVLPGDAVRIAWQPGHACPGALRQAAQRRCDDAGLLSPEDDGALPLLLRLAQEAGHPLQVDEAVWAALAAHRDARRRLSALETAYPDGPASAALQHLLAVPLPLFQAEGALFAVVAGRALIADERGLGKTVQAIAAAQLWRRHFGVQRVLVLCAPGQRGAWQRAWRRLAGERDAQLIDGGHHQRPAQWQAAAGVRIAAPEALQTDAAHLAHWAPDLVIVDEPQQLGLHADDWAALATAPQALVLSGAPLADLPALTDTVVAWLDSARLGPLAALRELQAASRGERQLGEDDVERLTAALSRLMLQRQREDVADQLPPVVHSERLLPLAPGQRAAHDRHAGMARRLLAAWQASGWCSDTDQWRLAQALQAMQQACHRAEPDDPASPLAEATVQALAAALDDLAQRAGSGAPRAAVLCASAADRDQLAGRLADHASAAGVALLAPGEPLPGGVDVVLQAGVPWRPRRQAGGPRGEAPAGQQWLYLVAQDGIDGGLFDTLAARLDLPRGPADGGARGWLQGEALQQWLRALQLALAAVPDTAT